MVITFWPCRPVVSLFLFSLLILLIASTTIPTTRAAVGTFMVADVPAGTYLVSVSAMFLGIVITGEQELTVDAFTTIATVTSTTVTTSPTSCTSRVTIAPSSTPVVTVSATVTTTKVETPQAPDYGVMSLLLSSVTIALVAILAVLILRRRK